MLRFTIDPGHTKKYNEGVIKGYYEGDAMFTLAKYLKEELLKYEDTDAILTRSENENPALAERGNLAVKNGSKVFISLHSNAVSNAESASYVCGFYSVKRKASENLCGEIVKAVTEVMDDKTTAWSRGALTKKTSAGSDYYGVIRSSVAGNSPVEYSFIIEHGFHTNKKECEFLMNDANLRAIAQTEANVLAKYFNLTPKKITAYSIDVGIFKDKSAAESVLAEIKKAGFANAKIVETAAIKTVEELARDIIAGKYGYGHATREKKLAEEGWLDFYTYQEIRTKVNEICK